MSNRKNRKNWSEARIKFNKARQEYRSAKSAIKWQADDSSKRGYHNVNGDRLWDLLWENTPNDVRSSCHQEFASDYRYGKESRWSIRARSKGLQVKGRKGWGIVR